MKTTSYIKISLGREKDKFNRNKKQTSEEKLFFQ
jgi:hypothetical protein